MAVQRGDLSTGYSFWLCLGEEDRARFALSCCEFKASSCLAVHRSATGNARFTQMNGHQPTALSQLLQSTHTQSHEKHTRNDDWFRITRNVTEFGKCWMNKLKVGLLLNFISSYSESHFTSISPFHLINHHQIHTGLLYNPSNNSLV